MSQRLPSSYLRKVNFAVFRVTVNCSSWFPQSLRKTHSFSVPGSEADPMNQYLDLSVKVCGDLWLFLFLNALDLHVKNVTWVFDRFSGS